MGMDDLKILLLHLFQCLFQVIKGFEMRGPGDTFLKQRFREKGDELCRCLCITRCKQGHIMTLRYLLLHKGRENALCSTIVVRRKRNAGGSYLGYSRQSILFT